MSYEPQKLTTSCKRGKQCVACKNAKRYQGQRKPTCNKGKPCEECKAKYARAHTRWRLVSDDDGHHYIIPADKEEAFRFWVECGPYWDGYEGEDFEEHRLNTDPSGVTFTDWKVD